jgi:CheY-like chemotaxis protein
VSQAALLSEAGDGAESCCTRTTPVRMRTVTALCRHRDLRSSFGMERPRSAVTRRKPAEPEGPATGMRRVLDDKERAPLVLLVDDVQDTRDLYADALEEAGLRVVQAVDGDHALWKVASLLPDLVVMDLAMPVLDGWQATSHIKSHPKTRHIRVVVLTGCGTSEDLQRA